MSLSSLRQQLARIGASMPTRREDGKPVAIFHAMADEIETGIPSRSNTGGTLDSRTPLFGMLQTMILKEVSASPVSPREFTTEETRTLARELRTLAMENSQ